MIRGPGIRRALLWAVVAFAVAPGEARACSICRCGDPAFNALGLNVYSPGTFRLALDWMRSSKSQGGGGEGPESIVESRFTATLSYSPSERVTLIGQVPWARRRLSGEGAEGAGRTTGRGLADPELYALVRLWSAPVEGRVGSRAWVGLQLGVKTPWGENDLREGGSRMDEHAQPGTGSTDWSGGVAAVYVVGPSSTIFASAAYRSTGSNPEGYRYGNAVLGNLGYEHVLGGGVDADVQLNFRQAGRDRLDSGGALDPDTGGRVLYLAPRLSVNLSPRLVARVSAQVPVARSLDGRQSEGTVWSAGLTYVGSL